MRISKQRRQTRKLVQILFGRHDVQSIYAGDIADCLECPLEMVEEELGLLYEEGVLEPVFELHCRLCGGVIATCVLRSKVAGPSGGKYPGCPKISSRSVRWKVATLYARK
jgi:hypothetical protein